MGKNEAKVLRAISRGPSYGYQIILRIREDDDGKGLSLAALYDCLYRLQRDGLITDSGLTVVEGCERKLYALTEQGRAALTPQRVG